MNDLEKYLADHGSLRRDTAFPPGALVLFHEIGMSPFSARNNFRRLVYSDGRVLRAGNTQTDLFTVAGKLEPEFQLPSVQPLVAQLAAERFLEQPALQIVPLELPPGIPPAADGGVYWFVRTAGHEVLYVDRGSHLMHRGLVGMLRTLSPLTTKG